MTGTSLPNSIRFGTGKPPRWDVKALRVPALTLKLKVPLCGSCERLWAHCRSPSRRLCLQTSARYVSTVLLKLKGGDHVRAASTCHSPGEHCAKKWRKAYIKRFVEERKRGERASEQRRGDRWRRQRTKLGRSRTAERSPILLIALGA